jgi:hypothetical protein
MTGLFSKCHTCRQPVSLEDRICGRCGAQLHVLCPSCGQETFIQSNCRYCRSSLYVVCPDKNCKKTQLISPGGRCRFCGAQTTDIKPD